MELHADGFELLRVDVRSFIGEGFLIRIPASNTGKDLQHMIALQIPQKPGCHISLQHESKKLSLRKSLKEQGLHGEVTLYYVYTQVDLLAAWKSLSWSSRKTCWWRRNCIGRNYPNERNQTIDSLLWVQPESGERHFTRQLAKLDFWPWFQPEPGERHFARHFAKLDFRPSFQPEPG